MQNPTAQVEHEATTSKIGEDQLFYCRQRGLSDEDAVSMIVNGFCKEVFRELPMEFAVEAQKLLGVSLEGASADGETPMLEIENLHVARGRHRRSCKGVDLDGARRRGARDHGPERLGQEHARERARRARRGYEVTRGAVRFEGKDLLALAPEERAREGVFLAFQYPVEIPGVGNSYFLQGRRSTRSASTAGSSRARRDRLPRRSRARR